ncbi:CATRA conflict system CASPASE/TPR repeat-associated protein [Actinosynnema sp. NPDC050801]|uniref:CATRA conflict system CASPASE/TPR repeat-associated protein n=1 Tax=unclassified Actinosynnema TaxID=2637065 RepID=UPI0033C0FE58
MTGPVVAEQELVAHFYAVGDAQETTLRAMWARCGRLLGADEPIRSTGLPVELPDLRLLPSTVGSALLGARQDHERNVQALVRREHEVLNLSVLLAERPGHSWRDFDGLVEALSDDFHEPLMGSVRLYLGISGEVVEESRSRADLSALLPRADLTPGWWHEGVAAGPGLALWETGSTTDSRAVRRFMVLAEPARRPFLSSWTWSDAGAAHLPPFARYLMHVAKIRDQLRVRRNYPDTAELCRRAEAVLSEYDAASAVPAATLVALIKTSSFLRIMRKSVVISWQNARTALGGELPSSRGHTAFTRDEALATWFANQLGDDADYLDGYEQDMRRVKELQGDLPDGHGQGQSLPPTATSAPAEQITVLAVADEWFAQHGGISTLNRWLCAALVAAHARVYCLVPKSSPEERADARLIGVELVDAVRVPGLSDRESLLRRPRLPDGVVVDAVIGHGRVTGHVARALSAEFYRAAAYLHVVHVYPDQVEWYKLDRENDAGVEAERRSKIELELAALATRAVPVGPRLDEWIGRELELRGAPRPVRLDPGFDVTDVTDRTAPSGVPQILLLGRAEDADIKGIDIAARAIGTAMRLSPARTRWELLIRGAPEGQAAALRTKALQWIDHPSVEVTVRNYSADRQEIDRDLRRASLVLMPSRVEGFGLVGHEAIVAGTPLLVSDRSGVGALLETQLPEDLANRVVLPLANKLYRDAELWGNRIAGALLDRPAAFRAAGAVRGTMALKRTWLQAAERLLAVVSDHRNGRSNPGETG